jgi:hypothetical protein
MPNQPKYIDIYRWKFQFDNHEYRACVNCKISGEYKYVAIMGMFQPIESMKYNPATMFPYSSVIVSPGWGEKLYYFDHAVKKYEHYLSHIPWDYRIVLNKDNADFRPDKSHVFPPWGTERWKNPLHVTYAGVEKTLPLAEVQTVHRPLLAIMRLIRDNLVRVRRTYKDVYGADRWIPATLPPNTDDVFVRT